MTDPIAAFLASYDPSARQVALALCTRVRALTPDASETLYPGWKNIGYSFDGTLATSFCAVGPHSRHVNLHFARGTDLGDPEGLLEGTGKQAHHVKVRTAEEAEAPALAALIEQAAALARP